jgi:hypothetical protein
MILLIIFAAAGFVGLIGFLIYAFDSDNDSALGNGFALALISLLGFIFSNIIDYDTVYKKSTKFSYEKQQTKLIIKSETPKYTSEINDIYVYNTINDSSQVYIKYVYNPYGKLINTRIQVKYYDPITNQEIYK